MKDEEKEIMLIVIEEVAIVVMGKVEDVSEVHVL